MAEMGRLTKEEWDDLEPLLAESDKHAHERFMASAQAKSLVEDSERTPGYQLLQHLKKADDQNAVRLFRAVEMYHHEVTRGDIAAAFLRGREIGRGEARADES